MQRPVELSAEQHLACIEDLLRSVQLSVRSFPSPYRNELKHRIRFTMAHLRALTREIPKA